MLTTSATKRDARTRRPLATLARRLATLLVLAVLASTLLGCKQEGIVLTSWSIQAADGWHPVTVPGHLDGYLKKRPERYVLRTRAALPREMWGEELTFAIPELAAMTELEVNGTPTAAIDTSLYDRYRISGPHRYRISKEQSALREVTLELTVHHAWLRSGWFDSIPEVTRSRLGSTRLVAVSQFNAICAIVAVVVGLVVTILYFFIYLSIVGPERRAYGIFAIGGASGLFYPAFRLGLLQPAFGVYDVPVMCVMLVIGAVATVHFSHAYFNIPPPSKVWRGLVAIAVVVAIVAHDPFSSVLFVGPLVILVTIANTTKQLVLCLRLRHLKPKPKNLYLIALAWPGTAMLGLPDFTSGLGLGEVFIGLRTACLGVATISMFQAVALVREHVLSRKRADRLNRELAGRIAAMEAKNREVELLNDELRRQIAARSRELAEKLSQVDPGEAEIELPDFQPGEVIEERYKVVRTIGAGGMGVVYEVERLADGKHLALKALASNVDPQARARFAREAQICANVKHPNVVAIFDVDMAKTGFIYLVMELVPDGATLYDVRRREKDEAWTLNVLASVCDGIAAIHEAGIVHRDLKPANILLSRGSDGKRPLVKITDFGISSLKDESKKSSTMVLAARAIIPSAPESHGNPHSETKMAFEPDPDGDFPTRALGDLPPERTERIVTDHSGEAHALESATNLFVGLSRPPPTPIPFDPPPVVKKGQDSQRKPNTPLTETGIIFGTPQYMAAELLEGSKKATRSSDIFSVAIICFEMLTGKRPFFEEPVAEALAGRPLPVALSFRRMCPRLAPEVADLLDRAMSHDAALRPEASELGRVLHAEAERLWRAG